MMKTNKTMKRWTLGVMLVFIASGVFAGEGGKAVGNLSVLPYLDTDYSVVSFANLADKSAKFSIVDVEGVTIYKEWVSKEGYSQKVLDFSNLKDGEYTAVLSAKGALDVSKTFEVKDHKLVSAKQIVVTPEEVKAFFNIVENTLYVSHLSFGSNSFGISIDDAFGGEVYTNEFLGNKAYSGKFDISALPKGEYTVSINSGSKEYSYDFRK